eukprot:CCRYP_003472-RA/>CCRYP_003472-RA protein AED:0.35 eAED:0.35 QI:758/1/1/1/0.5/0.33/3/116/393
MDSATVEESEGLAVVKVLAVVLERLVGANAHLSEEDKGQVTKFHALRAPVIGIGPYLQRIHKYASCSKECFILALIYIDRLIQRNNFLLTELNVHRVVITAVLLAAKFFDDAYYNNAYYAKVGGVLVSELNSLEVEFLFRINFSLRVAPDVFDKYNSELISHANAMGLKCPPRVNDALLQGCSSDIDQDTPQKKFSTAHLVQGHPNDCVAPMTQEAFYQQPQVGLNCTAPTQPTLQNPPQITPSPPPHPPHLQGSVSYASDLCGSMYEPYTANHQQATPAHVYQHNLTAQTNATSTEMLLQLQTGALKSNWPQVTAVSIQYQEQDRSHSQQGTLSVGQPFVTHQHYADYVRNEVMEWQMRQSDYGARHFVSTAGSEHPLRNVPHYVNYSPVES